MRKGLVWVDEWIAAPRWVCSTRCNDGPIAKKCMAICFLHFSRVGPDTAEGKKTDKYSSSRAQVCTYTSCTSGNRRLSPLFLVFFVQIGNFWLFFSVHQNSKWLACAEAHTSDFNFHKVAYSQVAMHEDCGFLSLTCIEMDEPRRGNTCRVIARFSYIFSNAFLLYVLSLGGVSKLRCSGAVLCSWATVFSRLAWVSTTLGLCIIRRVNFVDASILIDSNVLFVKD